jgi:hypothetical protein
MTLRRPTSLIALLILSAPLVAGDGRFDRDGTYVTTNFRVSAPNKEMAEKFGDLAEHYRKEKAIEWLGKEMPAWPERCPLNVQINLKQSGGATTFTFQSSQLGVQSQEMKIWGESKQLLYSVLPHEVTHTVLAYHFGKAVPRWADEGGSVLSENEEEWFSHDIRCREILNSGRGIAMRVLFTLKEYPRDMITVYAQGYSMCDFLINHHKGGRTAFLKFVGLGMKNNNRNWEQAVQEVYGYKSVDELQETWIEHLHKPPLRVAARTKTPTEAIPASRAPEIRSSGVSGVPMLEAPGAVIRGAAPEEDRAPRRVESKPTPRPDDRPPPIQMLLPPEPPRK